MPRRAAREVLWQPETRAYSLFEGTGDKPQLPLPNGSAWHAWLDDTPSFAFEARSGERCIVRKETMQRGGDYWYAYRRVDGRMLKRYLGRSADLTLARLEEVATTFAPSNVEDESDAVAVGAGGAETSAARNGREADTQPPQVLLATKLHLPRPPTRLVRRTHVLQRLQRGLERPLTLVAAPAGFGKSASLSAWAAQSGLPVAWVSLDTGDNDPAQFWAYTFAALNQAHPGVADTALAMVQSPQPPPITVALRSLLNALAALPDNVVLVLDDFHLIVEDEIIRALAALLEHPPAQLHLFLAARSEPALPLARLRAYDLVNEVRADDLRFRPDEVGEFLAEVLDVLLPADDILTLAERTDGWVAGVQLAGLSLRGHPDPSRFVATFTGSNRYVLTYLGEEMLAGQPEMMRYFLLHTSILERLCAPLCDAVTGHADGRAALERLERENLFLVPLDDQGRWYRYYHLFGDLLRYELERQHPALIPELHRRAAAWLEAEGWAVEATEHLFAVPDDDAAAGVIERAAPGMLMRGETPPLVRLLQRLPDAAFERRPSLCLSHAEALIAHGQLIAAEMRIEAAERAIRAVYDERGDGAAMSNERRTLDGRLLGLRAVLASMRGEARAALTLAEAALALLPPDELLYRTGIAVALGNAKRLNNDYRAADEAYAEAVRLGEAAGNIFLSTLALDMRSLTAVQRGQLRLAEELARQVIEIAGARGGSARALTASAHVMLGERLYERNDLVGARLALEKALELGEQWAEEDQIVDALVRLAKLFQAQGQAVEAAEAMRRAESLIAALARSEKMFPWLPPYVATMSARLALRQGRTDAVRRWMEGYARTQAALATSNDDQGWELDDLTYARICLADGEADKAIAVLNRLLARAEAEERIGSVAEVLMLRAMAEQAQGHLTRALDDLARSVELAAPEGYARVYLDEGIALRSLLMRLREREARGGTLRRYLDTLIAGFDAGQATARTVTHTVPSATLDALPEPLSEREREVLRLLAQGRSNQEIARQLVVAVSTVKTHVHHVFAKLNATDRLHAVTRARELGLLNP